MQRHSTIRPKTCSTVYPPLLTSPPVGRGGESPDAGAEGRRLPPSLATRRISVIEGLGGLDGVDLGQAHVVLAFDDWVHANQADELIRFLQRRDLGCVSVEAKLCGDIGDGQLSRLLEALDALNARAALDALSLSVDGPLDAQRRQALARSPACLERGGPAVWAMLFLPTLWELERADMLVGASRLQLAVLRAWVQSGPPVGGLRANEAGEAQTATALLAMALTAGDEALLQALGTVLQGRPVWLKRYPDAATGAMLRKTRVPWAMSCSLRCAEDLQGLRRCLRIQAGTVLQAIDLRVCGPLGEQGWSQLLKLLRQAVRQRGLRDVVLRLECGEGMGDIGLQPSHRNGLRMLGIDLSGIDPSEDVLTGVGRVLAVLGAETLSLAVLDLRWARRLVAQARRAKGAAMGWQRLSVGWPQGRSQGHSYRALAYLLRSFEGPGVVCLCAPQPLPKGYFVGLDAVVQGRSSPIDYEVTVGSEFPFGTEGWHG